MFILGDHSRTEQQGKDPNKQDVKLTASQARQRVGGFSKHSKNLQPYIKYGHGFQAQHAQYL